ncbi:hypothetical protein CEXT_609261 [Caerostris extrusa]|uniref:Uncharacterized protein n=1 Tax=Caerostris extrusa TaxID=172846 RepID=A0AAV4SQ46_CAEEX|nr:hypothetical protein CEXT_609261 [Caerostris extrusa]
MEISHLFHKNVNFLHPLFIVNCHLAFLVNYYSSLFYHYAYNAFMFWIFWPNDILDLRPLIFLYPKMFLCIPGMCIFVKNAYQFVSSLLFFNQDSGKLRKETKNSFFQKRTSGYRKF